MKMLNLRGRSTFIEKFTSIESFNTWKDTNPANIIHDIQIIERSYNDISIFAIYTPINNE